MANVTSLVGRNCTTPPNCIVIPGGEYREPNASIALRLTLFSLVILCSLVGNSAVVKAIRELPDVRKPLTYYLVTNLAVAELLGTVCLPFFQIYDELQTWLFGQAMCRVVNALMLLSYFVVPWSLAIIAVLRCKALVAHHIGTTSLSVKRASSLVITTLWLAGFGICFPTFVLATQVKTIYDSYSYWCIELFPGDTLETFPSPRLRGFYFIRFVLNFGIPGGIMMAAYGGVAFKLKRHLSRTVLTNEESQTINMAHTTSSEGDTVVIVVTPPPADAEQGTHRSLSSDKNRKQDPGRDLKEMEHDLLRMISVVILVYIGCYIPYQIFYLLEYFGITSWMTWRYFNITRKYVYLLTCFSSALHPVCYGTMCKFYAKVFSRLILCKKVNTDT